MLESLTGALDRRFLVNALLPSLTFTMALVFVFWADADPAVAVTLWRSQAAVLTAAVVIAAAALLACILSAAMGSVLRLYEGYWPGRAGRFLASTGKRWHLRRSTRLPDPLQVLYPPPIHVADIMPTRLGNILRSAEVYPWDRYGIDTAVIWPRLFLVLPEKFAGLVAAARGVVDLLIATSLLSSVFALVSGVHLLVADAPWWRFLACFWGGAAVAWLAYLGALAGAVTYGQHIRAAIDVHRLDLLDKLDLRATDEREQWHRLAYLWLRNVPLDVAIERGQPSPPSPAHTATGGPALPLSTLLGAAILIAGVAVSRALG